MSAVAADPVVAPVRVLIADDTVDVRRLLRLTLQRSGRFDVVGEAGDGQEAIDLAVELHPELVLLDLAMPVLDGLEALPLIRTKVPDTQVVVLSGFNADRMADQVLHAGAIAYVEKSHRPDEIIRRILEAIRPEPPAPPAGELHARNRSVIATSVEDMARDARERFRLAFELAPIGMAIVDLDGRFLEVNAEACKLAGVTDSELLGKSIRDLTHPHDWQAESQHLDQLVAGETTHYQIEKRVLRADGSFRWVLLSRTLVRGPSGDPRYFVTQAVDMTDRRAAEDALRERTAELARSNRDLSEFASVAAHDLKAPIQVIAGFAGILAEEEADRLSESGRDHLERIVRGADRMAALVNGLLAYCRVGSATHTVEPVDLGVVLDDVRSVLAEAIEERQALVSTSPLPTVVGDRVQLTQLLQNLVANSLRFARADRPCMVDVRSERTTDGWRITVSDNGVGIDPAHRERVFRMFERLQPSTEGTGIGLTICQRIIERRGGQLWIEDNPGGGTRMVFTLPDRVGGGRSH